MVTFAVFGIDNDSLNTAVNVLILVLVVVRSGARIALTGDNALHLDAMAVTDMLVALALGLFTAQRIEMYLRCRRLLTQAATAA